MTKHVHKYRRLSTTKGKPLWKCVLIGCPHVIYQEELVVGRETLCWTCGDKTVVKSLKQARPVCDDCKEDRKDRMEKFRKLG